MFPGHAGEADEVAGEGPLTDLRKLPRSERDRQHWRSRLRPDVRKTKWKSRKCKEPSGHPGIGVLSASHPLKGCVVSDQGELPANEVVAQLGPAHLMARASFSTAA